MQVRRVVSRGGQSVAEHEAPLGVGVADLDRESRARPQDVARPVGISRHGVLDRRDEHAQAHRQAGLHDHPCESEHTGCSSHVLLHEQHARGGLEVEATRVEADALADQRQFRMRGLAPAQVDQARRLRCRATDRMNGGIAPGEIVALDDRGLGAVLARKRRRFPGECRGIHVGRRRVDEIARHRGRVGGAST